MRLNPSLGLLVMLLAGCAATTPAMLQNATISPSTAGTAVNPERAAALAGITAAIEGHDYQRAITIESEWVNAHPTDLDFRHTEPMLYLLAGDRAGWDHARGDILQSWAQLKGKTQPPANPSFTVDMIKVGSDLIIADQCYERAGRL